MCPTTTSSTWTGLGIETTISAAELCAIGTWERVGGGYRVLDWEAVEVCLDRVRQDTGDDPRALAWEREHEAKIQAHMAKPMVVTPPCAACGTRLAMRGSMEIVSLRLHCVAVLDFTVSSELAACRRSLSHPRGEYLHERESSHHGRPDP